MNLSGAFASMGRQPSCSGPSVFAAGEILVGIRGAPQWRRAGIERASFRTDAEAALAAYRNHGADLPARLEGSFALAVLDSAQQQALLAVDRMGIERLAYASFDGGIVFSSSAEAVARWPGFGAGIRLQSVFDYLFFHMVPSPATLFERVHKIPPATCVEFRRGSLRTRAYWEPPLHDHRGTRFEELAADLHASLERGVRDSVPGERSGAFLSGGLDSSTVAGMLTRVAGRAKTFSIGFGAGEYDELEYARITSRWFRTEPHEYVTQPDDITSMFGPIARAYDEPFGNASALPTYCCARLAAQHGVDHLLAGDGGDELFAGNERYAKQQVFERYLRVPAVLRTAAMEPLLLDLPSWARKATLLRKASRYVQQARVELPRRLEAGNLLYDIGIANLLHPAFAAAVDTDAPLRHMDDVYAAATAASSVDRLLFYDWRFTLADNDLRKVETMCALAGVRVSYPMLHEDLVELSLRVPPSMKLRGTRLRHFYKQAMRDFLPPEVIDKRKHGFGLPFGFWLQRSERMQELIYGNLSRLRSRQIVRPELLDRLPQLNAGDDARYYGVLIWVLAMLEQWFQEHGLAP